MKQYQLVNDWQGVPSGTILYGPYPLVASHIPAYFTKENIPLAGTEGTNGFFKSAVENNPDVFKFIENP